MTYGVLIHVLRPGSMSVRQEDVEEAYERTSALKVAPDQPKGTGIAVRQEVGHGTGSLTNSNRGCDDAQMIALGYLSRWRSATGARRSFYSVDFSTSL